jgi:hypothetical protein
MMPNVKGPHTLELRSVANHVAKLHPVFAVEPDQIQLLDWAVTIFLVKFFTEERNVKRCVYPKEDCENHLFEDCYLLA